MFDFLKVLIDFFEKQNIPYMLSGSVAMSLYTQPRFTRDYDFVVNLKNEHINKLLKNFTGDYYINDESVKDAISRQKKMKFLDMNISVVSPEDLLLSKIIWIQEIQSGVQMEDIKLLSEVEGLDWNYINNWIKELKLKTFNLLSD